MADEEPGRRRRERDDGETRGSRERRGSDSKHPRPPRRRSGAELAQLARRELAEITGLKPEGVTSLEQQEDGTWIVTVELLELSRIPETDDVIGSYETELDETGELLGYRRVRRYPRSMAGEEQALRGG
jgi:ADP-ribose pyrophosphatase YjhB (NUDIX family)